MFFSGVWDLLLHHCDRAYRVPDLVRLTHSAGLKVVSFANPEAYELPPPLGKSRAAAVTGGSAAASTGAEAVAAAADDSSSELKSLQQAVDAMEPLARASLAELVRGNINKHVFYVSKAAAGGAATPISSEDGASQAAAAPPKSLLERLRDLGAKHGWLLFVPSLSC
eukprot:COSAG06_NODE_2835_length_6201_cov_127.447722_7_plen_167_part_00